MTSATNHHQLVRHVDSLTTTLNETIAASFLLQQQLEHASKHVLSAWKHQLRPALEEDRQVAAALSRALKEWGDLEAFMEAIEYQLEVTKTCLEIVHKQRGFT